MSNKNIDAEERCRLLMMAEIDGEISSEEKIISSFISQEFWQIEDIPIDRFKRPYLDKRIQDLTPFKKLVLE